MTRIYRIIFSFLIISLTVTAANGSELTIAAANSTCSAVQAVGQLFARDNDINVSYLCKSSGRLAKGLNGSTITADIYISANRKWIEYMVEHNLVEKSTIFSPWGNELIVATSKDSKLDIDEWQQLTSEKVKTILIGDPGTAPFGRYAKQAMLATDIWNRVKHKITTKKHITLLAETLAISDSSTVGVLFATNIDQSHRKLFSVNRSWHPEIRYFVAPLREVAGEEKVQTFLKFLRSNPARSIFSSENFLVLDE